MRTAKSRLVDRAISLHLTAQFRRIDNVVSDSTRPGADRGRIALKLPYNAICNIDDRFTLAIQQSLIGLHNGKESP
jgi:hypothetical protein